MYAENIQDHWEKTVSPEYVTVRAAALDLLQEEAKLDEIVKLVGMESLSLREKLVLLTAKSIREDFLFQDAFDREDAYTPPKKQFQMIKTIMTIYTEGMKKMEEDADFDFKKLEGLKILQEVALVKDLPKDDFAPYENLQKRLAEEISAL